MNTVDDQLPHFDTWQWQLIDISIRKYRADPELHDFKHIAKIF